jgi:hypothetical protein
MYFRKIEEFRNLPFCTNPHDGSLSTILIYTELQSQIQVTNPFKFLGTVPA